ncbi:hypothetical protein GOP47_0022052 [Adiantum capillus-veneris]|uniref:Uncharacterized protein n=1 Tax=Adiantum capillus-veneris TaxID=13818 RepID=A0A9D4Z757_ADICA|nr:hypothetical protein GOP47_0022052 [Adiantum capillus-veneris]
MREHAATLDRDLRDVLELASDAELHDLANILYGQSLLSPLLKSVTRGDGSHKKFDQETEEREALVERLESRFLYLGADAKETLRGWRPTYRAILLGVRAKLNVHCSAKLSTEDLEAEIFLHLLQQNTRERTNISLQSPWKHQLAGSAERVNHMDQYSKNLHVALRLGGAEFLKVLLKGGGVFSVSFLQRMVARRIGGRVLVEMARYQVAKEVVKKGGRAAAVNLQARVAVLAARQGLVGAASCYAALQRTSMLFGPLLWGTFLAEVVIKSVGTDYARVVKAIYAFAQIRLLRTYGWTPAKQGRPA